MRRLLAAVAILGSLLVGTTAMAPAASAAPVRPQTTWYPYQVFADEITCFDVGSALWGAPTYGEMWACITGYLTPVDANTVTILYFRGYP